jgi:hypothetical protein
MHDEQGFKQMIASTTMQAMQAAIMLWDSETVKAMTPESRAVFMAEMTEQYANKIIGLVVQRYGTKSSS